MRIHAFTTDRGGCFYYRIRQPLTALRRRGHSTSWGSGVDFETWEKADVLIAQYNHYEETVSQWERWAETSGKLCVWEADDDIFAVTQVTGHGNAYDNPETLTRMRRAIAASHLVTVTTPELAEVYAPINPNVVVLPNCVPDWLPHIPVTYPEKFTITYTCSPSHQEDFAAFGPIYAAHMNRHPTTKLRLYGPSQRPVGKPLNIPISWPIEVIGWKHQVGEYLRTITGSVGIAPLADLPFNRGKSGIKAMEYQALGLWPIVADWPQYRAVVDSGVTGFVCRTRKQWLDALSAYALLHQVTPDPNAAFDDLRDPLRRSAIRWTQSRSVHLWEAAYQEGLDAL